MTVVAVSEPSYDMDRGWPRVSAAIASADTRFNLYYRVS